MPMVTIATKIPHITFVAVDNTIPTKRDKSERKGTKIKNRSKQNVVEALLLALIFQKGGLAPTNFKKERQEQDKRK